MKHNNIDKDTVRQLENDIADLFQNTTEDMANAFTRLVSEYNIDNDSAVAILTARLTALTGEILSHSTADNVNPMYEQACVNIANSIQSNAIERGKMSSQSGNA